jgi:perosamine synthetase
MGGGVEMPWSKCRLDQEDIDAVVSVMEEGEINGFSSTVSHFEFEMESAFGVRHAIACANGTVALITALMAFKRFLGRDLVIAVPTWTYIAPVNAADLVGDYRLVDSDPRSGNMLPCITGDVNLILPVDMAGIPADYHKLKALGLPIVADAAESLGARYRGKLAGTLADISITSFHTSKIITTGEGGMIFTNNDDLAQLCRHIVNQGYSKDGYAKHEHVAKGYNFRMTGLQAALGISQVRKLFSRLAERRAIAALYREVLGDSVGYLEAPEDSVPSNYSFVIMLSSHQEREKVREYLSKYTSIKTKIWTPVHLQKPYLCAGYKNAEDIFKRHLRIPIHNGMSAKKAIYIAEQVKRGVSS